jgi:hypothetical protein
MDIFKLEIPVTNYDGNGVYYFTMYFANRFPTKQEVLALLQKEVEYPDKDGFPGGNDLTNEAIEILTIAEYPMLYSNLVMTNKRVNHPKWGDCPVSAEKIYYVEM